jgi:hypothetical protein
MASQFEYHSISPVFIEHGRLKDTRINMTEFDPRIGGYYRDVNGAYQYQAPYGPSYSGQLVAFVKKEVTRTLLYLLCGYDSGSGLEWKTVKHNPSTNYTLIDSRTGDVFDPRYSARCDPPWVCEPSTLE